VRWLFTEPVPREVDPIALTWWMHRRVAIERAPAGRVVIQFDYRDPELTRLWLILDRGEPSVCNTDPGFDPDLVVTTDSVSFMRVFSGLDDLAGALESGKVRIDGLPRLVREFPRWFLWSPFLPAVRARVNAPEPAVEAAP
jgi:hypothetical protein